VPVDGNAAWAQVGAEMAKAWERAEKHAESTFQAGEREEVNPWVERTQWLQYLVGMERAELMACIEETVAKPDVGDRARRRVRAAGGDSNGEAPDVVPATAAVHGEGGDCQAHTAMAAGVDDFRTHAEGARVKEPAVPVQAAAARGMGNVGPRSREGSKRRG
jgi:hypothetical protein